MTCRTCGDECEPNRGPGYIDQCAGCASEVVERLVAGFSAEGVDWEVVPESVRYRLMRVNPERRTGHGRTIQNATPEANDARFGITCQRWQEGVARKISTGLRGMGWE